LLEGYSKFGSALAEPAKAPEDWFEGVGGLIFITAGEREVMRDSIAERLEKHHTKVELIVQEGGLHDMFIDFFHAGEEAGY
jgi:acetyl esterase/lipase